MRLVTLLFLLLGIPAVASQTFKSGVDAVRVDVLVTEGNRPVSGLTAANFELRDSGVRQKIDAISVEAVPLSILLSLDTSASVEGVPLLHLKQAASALVQLLKPEDRGALLTVLRCALDGARLDERSCCSRRDACETCRGRLDNAV